jgi:phosphoglycerate dehydrogenase-like enzyme
LFTTNRGDYVNILVASSIHDGAIEHLRKSHSVTCRFGAPEDELVTAIADAEVLVFRSGVQISRKVLEAASCLKLIVRAGSGMDNIDWAYAEQRGIPIVRIAEPGARAVAEMSFALMLAMSRELFRADRSMREAHWIKSAISGHLLVNKTLGIIGAGNIGSLVGRLGVAWGMNVIGCTDNGGPEVSAELEAIGINKTDFDTVLSTSDYLSVHVPLLDSTRMLISTDALTKIKRGAFLVNLARGGVVDELAVREALLDGRLKGAAFDVHLNEGEGKLSPLADLDNVILTPHIGANAIDAQMEIGRIVIKAVESYEERAHRVA